MSAGMKLMSRKKLSDTERVVFGECVDAGLTLGQLGEKFGMSRYMADQLRASIRPTEYRDTEDTGTDKPLCQCGARLSFTTNSNGMALEVCDSCGYEGFIPVIREGAKKV